MGIVLLLSVDLLLEHSWGEEKRRGKGRREIMIELGAGRGNVIDENRGKEREGRGKMEVKGMCLAFSQNLCFLLSFSIWRSSL